MKLLSEYYSIDEKVFAKVYYVGEKKYVVIFTDEFGSTFNSNFENLENAKNYAEDWVLK